MANISLDLPTESVGEDNISLAKEFQDLHAFVLRTNEIERKANAGEELSADEVADLESLPAKMRRAVDITRILRRTNTGPAKVKERSPRASKKKLAQDEIDKLIDL